MKSSGEFTEKTVGIGILGAGNRVRGIIQRMLAHASPGQIRVVSVYDPDPEGRGMRILEDDLGYPVKAARTEEEVTGEAGVDWVFIGSWNKFHARQAVRALAAGKNVFCEKPLAISLDDCLAIRDAVATSGRTFAFGLVLRYSPLYRKIREILESGRLGEIISFEFNETLAFNHGGYIFGDWRRTRENSGGHLLEKCCHDLDLAHWFIDSLPVRAASFGGRRFYVPENQARVAEIGPGPDGFPAYSGWKKSSPYLVDPFSPGADIADHQVAILEYANGVRGTFHTNCNAAIPERRFYLCGARGALRADLWTNQIEVADIGWDAPVKPVNLGAADGHGGGDVVMAASLYRSLVYGEAPHASIAEGLISAVTAFAMDDAMRTGQVVDLAPYWRRAGLIPEF